MLVAMVTALILIFGGGGGLDFYLTTINKAAKQHIAEKERREQVIDTGKTLAEDLKSLGEEIDAHFEDLVMAHADFDATASDFDAAVAKLKYDQQVSTELILDARDKMHSQMTKDEWTAVFAEKQ